MVAVRTEEHALRALRVLVTSHPQWPRLHLFDPPATLEPPLSRLRLHRRILYAQPDFMSVARTTLPAAVVLVVTVRRPVRAYKGQVLQWSTRMALSLSPQLALLWLRRAEAVQALGSVVQQA